MGKVDLTSPKNIPKQRDKDSIVAKLDASEQHGTFSQETKAGLSYVDFFEEVASFDLNHTFSMNLIWCLNGNMTLAEMSQ